MKKILFSLMALVASMSMNAQVVKLMKGETVVATYRASQVDNVVFEEVPYVEIGGRKWATMNLGATTVAGSLSTCAGDYYQWGSVNTLYSSVSWSVTWKSGKESGFVDANKEYTANADLPAANDVVTQTLGDGWRMPTQADFEALHNACTSSSAPTTLSADPTTGGVYWLADNQSILPEYTGVAGILYVATADPSKRVFFPAAGSIDGTQFYGGSGFYWSSSVRTENTTNAKILFFRSSSVSPSNYESRCYGYTIRPVKD